MFVFPFEVPADLSALSAEEFATFAALVREHARAALADEASPPDALMAYRELATGVQTEETSRTAQAAAAADARAALSGGLLDDPAPAPEPGPDPAPEPDPAPGTPPTTPPAPAPGSTLDDPPSVPEAEPYAVIVASSDAPATQVGTTLTFAQAGQIIENRLARYPQGGGNRRSRKQPIREGGAQFRFGDRTVLRHSNINIQRQLPPELQITSNKGALTVLEYAARQSRLPGGSLIASTTQQVAAGRSLTAAAGWCAPSEIIYDLCMLEGRDGILDLPEVQATRGGFQIPENGGPDFSEIFNSIGDDGDVILTEYEVENGAEKVCTEVPCPDFVDIRLDVAYICITGAFLQQRGYPEIVNRFTQGGLVALDHKVNTSVIARMVAGSGSPVTIPDNSGGDDAVAQLLSAMELAKEDIKYRYRIDRSATMEVVLPYWAIPVMRAALARRRGVSEWNVSDAEILAAFTTRGIVPHFVYGWQDAYSGTANGPGRETPITAFLTDISFLIYPAGTWVKSTRDVINLDTVYDNAMLTTNQFTALFAEDGFNVMQMCRGSRLYTVGFDPNGLCCA